MNYLYDIIDNVKILILLFIPDLFQKIILLFQWFKINLFYSDTNQFAKEGSIKYQQIKVSKDNDRIEITMTVIEIGNFLVIPVYNNSNLTSYSIRIKHFHYEVMPDDYTQYNLSFKVIVIGDSDVGKSCLTNKATNNIFEENYNATVGFEYFIVGPKDIGKTFWARKFSFLREIIFGIKYNSPFYIYTFNLFTRSSYFYGISTLKDKKFFFWERILTKSIIHGNSFIGENFNISSEDCMKTIKPILKLKFKEDILISGKENEISLEPDFFL